MPKQRFNKRLENLESAIWSKIAQIDELKGQWVGGARLSPQVLGGLKKSVLITSTGASTRIEGARLSDSDVEKLMQGLVLQKFSNRDKQEVKGYYDLLKNTFESWQSLRLSESLIKHFHEELLKYTEKDILHRGEYKKKENKVMMVDPAGQPVGSLFETTPAYLTPKEMQELVEWARDAVKEKKIHPLLLVGNFVVEFLNIHPFEDGNGRLSRVLTNLLLLQTGYLFMPYVSHESLIEDHKVAYYNALRKSQKTFKSKREDVTFWLTFFLEMIYQQAQKAVEILSQEKLETILSQKQLLVWQLFQDVAEVSAGVICQKTKIARPTVNQVLTKLLSLGKIEKIGLGRSTRYRKV